MAEDKSLLEEQLLDKIAERIKRLGLEAPAILFLEFHKPLSFLVSQVLYFSTPFLGLLLGFENISLFAQILSQPGGVERLIRKLEEA